MTPPEIVLRNNLLSTTLFLLGQMLWFSSFVTYSCGASKVVSLVISRVAQLFIFGHVSIELVVDKEPRTIPHGIYGTCKVSNRTFSCLVILCIIIDNLIFMLDTRYENNIMASLYDQGFLVPSYAWFSIGGGKCITLAADSMLGFYDLDKLGNTVFILGTFVTCFGGLTWPFSTLNRTLILSWLAVSLWVVCGILYLVADLTRGRRTHVDIDLGRGTGRAAPANGHAAGQLEAPQEEA